MEYRRLGRSGLLVSEVALGSWLTYGEGVEAGQAVACIDRAYELGINFFDTANVYAAGRAEEIVGPALKKFRRDTYVLATKCFFAMGDKPNQKGLSRKHIVEQCEASLRRLGHEYVDLYQCHRYDRNTPIDETLRALDDLVRQGKVLYVGVSQWPAAALVDAHHWADKLGLDKIVSNQPQYNMFNRRIEREVIGVSERLGIGQVVYSPLAQGVLTGKYKPGQIPPDSRGAKTETEGKWMQGLLADENLQKVQKLAAIAGELGMTMAQLALAWCLRQANVSSVIVGASKPSQVDDNAGAAGRKIPEDAMAKIEEILGPVPRR